MHYRSNPIISNYTVTQQAQRPGYGDVNRRNPWRTAGIIVSVLFHLVLFWFLLHIKAPTKKTAAAESRSGALVYMRPMASSKPARPKAPPVSKSAPEKKIQLAARKNPPPSKNKAIEAPQDPVPAEIPPVAITPPQAEPEDMMARIQAARKRRADTDAEERAALGENSPPAENEAERGNRIARENIASAQKRNERGNTGGVFEIRHVGYRNAEFVFRGWSINSHRNALQLIEVEQGSEADIRVAVIKRMIDIIRTKKEGDFIWESQRLGRLVTLSARVEDTVGLQQFLMLEFFSGHV